MARELYGIVSSNLKVCAMMCPMGALRRFVTGTWKNIKKFWFFAFWPILQKVLQKVLDYIAGDAVVRFVHRASDEMHLPKAVVWVFAMFSKYPIRSSLLLMFLTVSISAAMAVLKEPKEGTPQVSDMLDVQLSPSSGPSDRMLLAVTNKGKKQEFHATCRVTGRRNDPNTLHRATYDLSWENERNRKAVISRGESRNLLIATADIDRKNHLEEVRLVKLSGGLSTTAEWSRWHWPQGNTPKPEYDLEISIFGERHDAPKTQYFTIKCGGATGALEMTLAETPAESERKSCAEVRQPSSAPGDPPNAPPSEAEPSQIRASALSLADEIRRFLRSSGPRPKVQIRSDMTEEEILEADSRIIGKYVERVHFFYLARYKERLQRTANEFHALGIHDPELDALIDPQVQNEHNLRTIVEKLHMLAARIK